MTQTGGAAARSTSGVRQLRMPARVGLAWACACQGPATGRKRLPCQLPLWFYIYVQPGGICACVAVRGTARADSRGSGVASYTYTSCRSGSLPIYTALAAREKHPKKQTASYE
jgi:hypothetical protein